MSTIAARAVSRAAAGELVVIDYAGHDIKTGYIIQGPSSSSLVEWTTPDAAGAAAAARILGSLTRSSAVLIVERIDHGAIAVEQCQRVTTEREAQHLSRIRGAAQYLNARTGEMKDVPATAWLIRTPATDTAKQLLGQSAWTYLCSPVGSPHPGETQQPGTAHAYHSRAAAERAIRDAQQRGRTHAQHAEAIEVSA